MNRSPAHAGRGRRGGTLPGAFAAAVSVALTGFGFAAAFGWLWFPALRDVLLPGLFSGTPAFRPPVFGLGLGAGCLLYGGINGRLQNGPAWRQYVNAFLAHGLCLALLALAGFCRENAVPGTTSGSLPDVVAGLAASLPGVWWFSRLLARGAGTAVAALAWAALAALLLSVPLARLHDRRPGSPAEEPDMLFAALVAGLTAGLLTALFLLWRDNRGYAGAPPLPSSLPPPAPPLPSPDGQSFPSRTAASPAGILAAAALLFFGLGSLNVFARDLETLAPAAAHACGLILSACILAGLPEHFRNRAPAGETGPASEASDGTQPGVRTRRCLLAGTCGLAVLSLCLPAFPQSARFLFPLVAALPEAASLALCAALLGRAAAGGDTSIHGPPASFMTGLTLALLLAAVNAGYLAGTAFEELAGGIGPALPGLGAVLLLAAAVFLSGDGRTRHPGASDETAGNPAPRPEETPPHATEGSGAGSPCERETTPKTVALHPATAAQLTERERVLALLLVRGYSNKEISEALSLSENTVRWYIKKLNKRTGATDRPGLIAALLAG